jgi:hypothetical protein
LNFFELTGEQLSRIYTSLERVGEKEVRERLDGVGVGASLSLLREFYREHPQDPFAEHHAAVAAWLVATVGPAVRETTDFELALTRDGIVAPRWVLARPIRLSQHRRCPARPVAWPSAWDRDDMAGWVKLAYQGLLEHLDTLFLEVTSSEISTSAIQWRLVALVDGLLPERSAIGYGQTTATRLTELLRRTKDLSTSMIERSWLAAIDATLVWRRHALTHLSYEPKDGSQRWSFRSCVDPMLSLDELLTMSAGLSLAVMDNVADALRSEPERYIRSLISRCEADAY